MGLIFCDCVRDCVHLRVSKYTFSHPNTAHAPGDSISKMAFAAFSDHGRWAAMSAHAKPSSMRYLALVLIDSGISESSTELIHVHSFPVCPSGSMGLVEAELMLRNWFNEQGEVSVAVIGQDLFLDRRIGLMGCLYTLKSLTLVILAFHLWHQNRPVGVACRGTP
jgi:hypothetical protein